MDDDTFVYYTSLPKGIHEMVIPCQEGYTVYIDKNLSSDGRKRAYRHALSHIERQDFNRDDVEDIENGAHDLQ